MIGRHVVQRLKPQRVHPVVYKLMLVAATVIWGFSFLTMKNVVEVLEPSYLLGFRFLATFLLLCPFMWKKMKLHRTKRELMHGAIIGVAFFMGFWLQTVGLTDTTPGKNAFLTSSYCVMVPFVSWVAVRVRPALHNIVAAFVCITGVGLVSLDGSLSMRFGDFMTLAGAVAFAIHIVLVSRFATKDNVLALTQYQFLVCGVLALGLGAFTEQLPALESLTQGFFVDMFYNVVFASALALIFMNVGLAHVPPAQASLLMSLEAVFGVLFSVLFYGEELTFRLFAGFALIFAAIVVSETFPLKEAPWKRARTTSS